MHAAKYQVALLVVSFAIFIGSVCILVVVGVM